MKRAAFWAAILSFLVSGSGSILTAQQVSTILTAVVSEQECDANSPAFQKLLAGPDPFASMQLEQCVHIADFAPIYDHRFVLVPSGSLSFRFFLFLSEALRATGPFDGTSLHATYKVTVTAQGPNGEVARKSGTVKLFGSMAPDAPAGALASGLQANPGGTASADLNIPLNVDWAESTVSFTLETTQGISQDEPIQESCTTAQDKRVGLMCTFPEWVDQATMEGPDLSAVNAGLTLPAAISNSEFALFVMPAAQFQLPIMPVAIVYAPLGNGGQVTSSYQITTITGTSAQIGNTNASTTSWTSDDKTTYNGGLTISDVEKKWGGGTTTLEGVWDDTAELENQFTYGTTGQIINSAQISTTFAIPGTTTLPLTKLDWWTQPFWGDMFIAVVDPQFAIWNYPGGHLVQPLGSAVTLPIHLRQLVECSKSVDAQQTASPNNSNQSHFIAYAGPPAEGTTLYVWLSSQQCSDIASLDQFHAKKTQSTTPLAWRRLYGGAASTTSPLTVSSSQSTQLSAGQTSSNQWTTKVTSARTNTSTTSATATLALNEVLSITGMASGSWSNTNTQGHTTVITYTAENSANLQSQTQASTTIQDSSGMTAPVNILQDSIFQGIAVQDTDMHYPTLDRARTPVCCIHLPPRYVHVPQVEWRDFRSKARREQTYVIKTPYGDIAVHSRQTPKDISMQLQRLRSEAIRRHIPRPVPDPGPATLSAARSEEVLQTLRSLQKPSPELLNLMRTLQPRVPR